MEMDAIQKRLTGILLAVALVMTAGLTFSRAQTIRATRVLMDTSLYQTKASPEVHSILYK